MEGVADLVVIVLVAVVTPLFNIKMHWSNYIMRIIFQDYIWKLYSGQRDSLWELGGQQFYEVTKNVGSQIQNWLVAKHLYALLHKQKGKMYQKSTFLTILEELFSKNSSSIAKLQRSLWETLYFLQ